MKYSSILTLVAFLVVSAGSAFAQEQDLDVSANVIDQLELTQIQGLDFGTILVGNSATLNSLNGTETNTTTDAQLGILEVDGGNSDSDVQITSDDVDASNEITMNNTTTESGDDDVTVELDFAFNNDGSAFGNDVYNLGDSVSLSEGDGRLIVGGTFDATDVTEGVYNADVTFTVDLDI